MICLDNEKTWRSCPDSFCMVGTRIVTEVENCTKDFGSDLFHNFCKPNETVFGTEALNDTSSLARDDFVCDTYFEENHVGMTQGIKGLMSNAFYENLFNKYRDNGDAMSNSSLETEYSMGGGQKYGYILVDIYTSFTILVGIFFPSCTGERICDSTFPRTLEGFHSFLATKVKTFKMAAKSCGGVNEGLQSAVYGPRLFLLDGKNNEGPSAFLLMEAVHKVQTPKTSLNRSCVNIYVYIYII